MAVGSSGDIYREVITAGGSTAAGVRLAEEAVGPFSSPDRRWEVAVAAELLSHDGVRRGVTLVAAVGRLGAGCFIVHSSHLLGKTLWSTRLISLWVDFREDEIFICQVQARWRGAPAWTTLSVAEQHLSPRCVGCRGGGWPWTVGVPEDCVLDGCTEHSDLLGLLGRQVRIVGEHGFLLLEFI